MRYSLFLFALLLFGCGKEAPEAGNGTRLQSINAGGKIHQSFEYDGGLLVKENWFNMCDRTPSNEYFYKYTDGRLDTIRSVVRSLYSSTSSICDPASGLRSEAAVKYNNQNQIVEIIQSNGIDRRFQYNAQGFIVKQVITHTGNEMIVSYTRDAAGNITAQSDSQGNMQQYEYDNKQNPYYLIKKQTDIITASYNSPNNVVKIISGSNVHEIRYEYNRAGLPVKMFDNGSTYEFIYQ